MTFKDDASGATLWAESAPAGVDYYFVAGGNMDDVIAGYRQLTGAAPMFPKAAFGLFMSKERYQTQDRLVDVVKNFRRKASRSITSCRTGSIGAATRTARGVG